jgi:hypothetical protein
VRYDCIQNIDGEKLGRLRNCEENSTTELTEIGCWDVRRTEIAQACPRIDLSINNVKPSGYATVVLISFSLTILTCRFKTLGQRTKPNTILHYVTLTMIFQVP